MFNKELEKRLKKLEGVIYGTPRIAAQYDDLHSKAVYNHLRFLAIEHAKEIDKLKGIIAELTNEVYKD